MKEIMLTKRQVALVDDEDFEWLSQWKWHAYKDRYTYYARRNEYKNGKWRTIHMHREILGLYDAGAKADHKDHNGLNNQRYNLRASTLSQNCANVTKRGNASSKYLGVSWNKLERKWRVRVNKEGVTEYYARFDDENEAALAYNVAAIKFHGEFANLNVIT